ncbi:hypothetical protein E2C01_044685 [Portunus trituberculatus]|uniref:Uncharacterized protein n=1 Tax=Portunus trituberculatus TaxID=210409 RepID=A0A5B7FW91_PORTR|nr:hypothetical protein [Portunus trituberculatus]
MEDCGERLEKSLAWGRIGVGRRILAEAVQGKSGEGMRGGLPWEGPAGCGGCGACGGCGGCWAVFRSNSSMVKLLEGTQGCLEG